MHLSLGQRKWGFALCFDCYLSQSLLYDPKKTGSIFPGKENDYH